MHQYDSGPAPATQGDPGRTPEADAAVWYWQSGMRPVLLTPVGARVFRPGRGMVPSDGKDPIGKDWAFKVYADEEEIWAAYRAHPGAGVGLALGLAPEGSPHYARLGDREPCGLVDLEVDDPEAAAPTLAAIFGPGGPPECGWDSARGRHRAFLLHQRHALALLDAGIHQAVLDGKHHKCLAGLELRLGTLDPAAPRQVQSVAPPTRTLNKDGTLSGPRTLVVRGKFYEPIPARLLHYLINHLGDPAMLAAQRAQAAARPAVARPVRVAGHLIFPAATPGPVPRAELAGLDPLDRVELALDRLGTPPEWLPGERHFVARCPAHHTRSGRRDNLDAREAEDGTLLITCYAGCEFGEVMDTLGLREADAYVEFRRHATARAGRRRSNLDAGTVTGPAAVTDAEADAWAEEQDRYAAELITRPARRAELADRLGLPPAALDLIQFGWKERNAAGKDEAGAWIPLGPAWTWPEHDHRGRVVGINRRFVDPAWGKKFIGSRRGDGDDGPVTHLAKRGLVYPVDFRDRPGPVWVVEGESDALALACRGAAVVGRPGDKAGLAEVALLLAGDPRDVVVLGENDRKDGTWPGDPDRVADELERRLRRAVGRTLPPEGCKDAREYVIRLIAGEGQ